MKTTLKPHTVYGFSTSDLEFVLEIAKVGHVHLLSNQVSLLTDQTFSFKEYGEEESKKCDGLKIPDNWAIEHIGKKDNYLYITFGVKKSA